jgi:hypothetical protein
VVLGFNQNACCQCCVKAVCQKDPEQSKFQARLPAFHGCEFGQQLVMWLVLLEGLFWLCVSMRLVSWGAPGPQWLGHLQCMPGRMAGCVSVRHLLVSDVLQSAFFGRQWVEL